MHPRFTRAEYDRLPEGFPAQLIGGCLVKDPPRTYGQAVLKSQLFSDLAGRFKAGFVVPGPICVGIDVFNAYHPDVVVLRSCPSLDAHDVGIPLLAVEILAPETERFDRGIKRRKLIAAGVAEVWIVDPVAKTVEVHTNAGRRVAAGDDVLRSDAVPGFEVVPKALFA